MSGAEDRVFYSGHGLRRRMARDVSHDLVVQTIEHPEYTQPGDSPGSTEAVKDFNGYEIHVVYERVGPRYKVITTWKEER